MNIRYVAIAAVLMVLAGACRGDGEPSARSASDGTCIPAPSVDDETLVGMVLSKDEVPLEMADLPDATVYKDRRCTAAGVSITAARQYFSPEPFPRIGAQRLIVTASVHSSIGHAEEVMQRLLEEASEWGVGVNLGPEWQLISYEDLERLHVGEDADAVHYVAGNAEGLVFLETYWVNFRRDNVTGVLIIRAPLGNISDEEFESLATKLDQRVLEGLRSLR